MLMSYQLQQHIISRVKINFYFIFLITVTSTVMQLGHHRPASTWSLATTMSFDTVAYRLMSEVEDYSI